MSDILSRTSMALQAIGMSLDDGLRPANMLLERLKSRRFYKAVRPAPPFPPTHPHPRHRTSPALSHEPSCPRLCGPSMCRHYDKHHLHSRATAPCLLCGQVGQPLNVSTLPTYKK